MLSKEHVVLYSTIKEKLLSLPKTDIYIELVIRTDSDKHKFFNEYTRKDGSKILELISSEYLSFNYSNKESHESVMISYFNMATLKDGFRDLEKFALESFICINGEYTVEPNHIGGYSIKNLIGNKSLLFIPKIILNDNENQEFGFTMSINDINYSGFVQYDTLFQLISFIKHFDLYSSSKSLINTALLYRNLKDEMAPKDAYIPKQPSARKNKEMSK